jgi:hypothetical protein
LGAGRRGVGVDVAVGAGATFLFEEHFGEGKGAREAGEAGDAIIWGLVRGDYKTSEGWRLGIRRWLVERKFRWLWMMDALAGP